MAPSSTSPIGWAASADRRYKKPNISKKEERKEEDGGEDALFSPFFPSFLLSPPRVSRRVAKRRDTPSTIRLFENAEKARSGRERKESPPSHTPNTTAVCKMSSFTPAWMRWVAKERRGRGRPFLRPSPSTHPAHLPPNRRRGMKARREERGAKTETNSITTSLAHSSSHSSEKGEVGRRSDRSGGEKREKRRERSQRSTMLLTIVYTVFVQTTSPSPTTPYLSNSPPPM
mmetsp:Transcript_34946/g.90552  ORF Transcript_34946/g.90552 Transcript_34946/m.90552 type:complete len:230 (-) Transcript_34946:535-1224(-)